jgi:4-methylaminobutanoate oxidase (formaldehyde-forming)
MVGLFEGEGAAWNVSGVPKDFSFGEIEPDWERLAPYLEKAMNRVPSSLNVGAKKLFCGPESFTPDNGPVVGEAPELKNYFVCAGLNSIGILSGGGLGRLMARWIKTGSPDMDVTGMNIDRFRSFHGTPSFRRDRVSESLGDVYKCHYPFKTKTTARGVKRSPLHQRLEGKGATFRDVSGWECADWFEADEDEKKAFAAQPLGWGKPPWFQRWAEEHNACRTKCALIDMSFMVKKTNKNITCGTP